MNFWKKINSFEIANFSVFASACIELGIEIRPKESRIDKYDIIYELIDLEGSIFCDHAFLTKINGIFFIIGSDNLRYSSLARRLGKQYEKLKAVYEDKLKYLTSKND